MSKSTTYTIHIKQLFLVSITFLVSLAPLLYNHPALAADPNILSIFAGTGSPGPPTPGPATSSDLGSPGDVARDSSGNVYISDTSNCVIEKVTPTGTMSIFAGSGTCGTPTPGPATSSDLGSPWGVAVDNLGNVYIVDQSNHVVEKVTPSGILSIIAGNGSQGAPTPGPATSSDLNAPYVVAVDSLGNVYIADYGSNVVEKVTPSGTLSIFAGTGNSGAPTPGPATSSDLNGPTGIAVDSSDNVYIADYGDSTIEKVTPTGTLSVIAGTGNAGPPTPGPATSSDLNSPAGVVVDNLGNVYIGDGSNNLIEKVTPSGTLSIFAGTGNSGPPTPGPATSSDLNQPYSVAVDNLGNIYIADFGNSVVEKITVPTTTTTNISNAVNSASITITTPANTNITCSSSVTEASLAKQDAGYSYPLGLVNFCFATLNTNNQVSLTFVTNLTPSQVVARDFNSTTGTYTTIPGAVITQTTYNSQPALNLTYTIVDNGSLDSNSTTGAITDPVGLAVTSPGAPNTGFARPTNTNNGTYLIASGVALAVTGLILLSRNRRST